MQVVGLGDNVFDVWEGSGLGYPGGNAVNVSVSAARLGCDAAYVGAIADDKWGRAILAALRAEDMDTSACQAVAGASTKRCIEVPDGPGHRWVRNELGDAWPGYRPLTDRQLAKTNAADAILTSCNAKCVSDLPRLAGRAGVLSFDFGEKPAYRTPEYLGAVAPYIDLAQFSCSGISEDEAARLYTSSGLECPVLITRASCAPLLFSGDGCVRGRAAEGPVRDTLGAGDSFVTALVIALLWRGWCRGKALPAMGEREGALLEAADHAAHMCQLPRAFGHGLVFEHPAAVVFDNDGVIVDSEPLYGRITQEFVRSRGAELSTEDLRRLRGASEKDQLQIIAPYIGCTTEEALVHYIKYMGSELGWGIGVRQDVYSSDSTPFADKGIPAVSFARIAPGNTATIHNSYDTMAVMKGQQMVEDIDFIIAFTERMANAKRCPVERKMPDNMKEKLDIYLTRKRDKR